MKSAKVDFAYRGVVDLRAVQYLVRAARGLAKAFRPFAEEVDSQLACFPPEKADREAAREQRSQVRDDRCVEDANW